MQKRTTQPLLGTAQTHKYKLIAVRCRFQRGQAAVLALLVMLLMAFAGALFVTIVGRNLINAAHQNRVETADFYAQAGIQYADDNLTTSDEGADWRPDPTPTTNTNDPDYSYIQAGFARYNMGNGRFLLRLSYNPSGANQLATPTSPIQTAGAAGTSDANSRYIKIEAVGRQGIVDPNDPTTFDATTRNSRTNSTLVAYKPIGITDYDRYETDIDHRSDIAALGVPSRYDNGLATSQTAPDVPTPAIVTPGVFDFSTFNNSVNQNGYQPFPIITQYGAPDAYLYQSGGSSSGTILPNNSAGLGLPAPVGTTYEFGGGSIRSNASLRFFGENILYLNNQALPKLLASVGSGANAQVMQLNEDLECANSIIYDQYNPAPAAATLQTQQAALILDPPPGSTWPYTPQNFVAPSNAPPPTSQPTATTGFNSFGGAIRDGASGNDIAQLPRNVKRLEPPVIDAVNSVTGLTRYRDMALNSAPRNSSWRLANAAQYGYGQVVYVNNTTDVQSDTSVPGTKYSLIDEWLNGSKDNTGSVLGAHGWSGGIYTPPGAELEIGDLRPYGYLPAANGSGYGFKITRHDVDANGNPVDWLDPTTAALTSTGSNVLLVPFDDLHASNVYNNTLNNPPSPPLSTPNYNNDAVVVFEGNVRISGIASCDPADSEAQYANESPQFNAKADQTPRHITIVTYGTAYIDGSVLRGNPSSSIAILAENYVVVNPTQFVTGRSVPIEETESPIGKSGVATVGDGIEFSGVQGISDQFRFGLPNGETPVTAYGLASPGGAIGATNGAKLALYLAGTTEYGTGELSLQFYTHWMTAAQLSPPMLPNLPVAANTAPFNPMPLPVETSMTPPDASAQVAFGATGTTSSVTGQTIDYPAQTTIDLSTAQIYGPASSAATNYVADLYESQPLELQIARTGGSSTLGVNVGDIGTGDPVLRRAAILPNDIRIEALLYAQDKSFFVIPGDWFSPNADDTIDKYCSQTTLTPAPGNHRPRQDGVNNDDPAQQRFPFYGQPIDMKITIYGSVSEAHPADIAAQAAWMRKWGWIPQFHGSMTGLPTATGETAISAEFSGHNVPTTANPNGAGGPTIGLTIIYNPQLAYPASSPGNAGTTFQGMRVDANGNYLPFAPRLPVCPGLLYSGEEPQLPSS